MFRILICLLVLLCMSYGKASAQSFGDAFSSQSSNHSYHKCNCKKVDDTKTIASLRSFLSGLAEDLKNKWQLRDFPDAVVDEEPRVLAIFEHRTWAVKCADRYAARPAYQLAVNIVKDELRGKLPPIRTPFGIVFVFDKDNKMLVEKEVSGIVIRPLRKSTQDMDPPVLSAQRDVDFGPYMADLQRKIKRAWFPPGLISTKQVVLTFKIHSNGALTNLRMPQSSGLVSANQACLTAVENAGPFGPLPDGAPPDVDIQFTFNLDGLTHKCEAEGDPLCEFALSSSSDLVWYRRTNLHVPASDLVLPGRFYSLYDEF